MKILKYIFFLTILTCIALTVFVATQDSNFSIVNSKEIKLSKKTVFNYINDLKNFEQWQSFNIDSKSITYDSITKGENAKINWKSDYLKNIKTNPNDSLVQRIKINNTESELIWKLNTSNKSTILTLEVQGKMDFITKFKALFLGTNQAIDTKLYEDFLNNINHHLVEEYSKFDVKNENISLIEETFYIQQNISCKTENLGEHIFTSIKQLKEFCNENNLVINGDAFTIFEGVDFTSGQIEYKVCLPITTEIFTNQESDIIGGKTETFYAYKTTLIGDYSHIDKAWSENSKGINDNKLTRNANVKSVSVFKKTILDTNKPSEWITELLTPINESVIYTPEIINDSITVK